MEVHHARLTIYTALPGLSLTQDNEALGTGLPHQCGQMGGAQNGGKAQPQLPAGTFR
jgi:hypothetical protein